MPSELPKRKDQLSITESELIEQWDNMLQSV